MTMIIQDNSVKTGKLINPVNYKTWLTNRFDISTFEASSFDSDTKWYSAKFTHPLVDAADIAFNNHLPLEIRPDDFWMVILQGFATHINQNAKKYRKLFVDHDDKIRLEVRRDTFIKGDRTNAWQDVFSEFADKIATHISLEKKSTLVEKFTTSSVIDIASFHVGLMDAMSSYFTYVVQTKCGIPEFYILGSEEDWISIKDRFVKICSWFTNDQVITNWKIHLLPILEKIVNCFNQQDLSFWRDFYREKSQSGGLLVTGWIQFLFPYIKNYRNDIMVNKFEKDYDGKIGTSIGLMPSGMSNVPFIWEYYTEIFNMHFMAGHIGVTIENSIVKPVIGWIVR